jgi:hypothetical protein
MQYPYPLAEKIGDPDLLVGRQREFTLLDNWLANIPRRLSKSRVILARRKSGKTAVVQRIFNRLWNENGAVIPFYFDIKDSKVWYPDLAINYYCTFVSQYISFLERDAQLVKTPLSLTQIKEYGLAKSLPVLVNDVTWISENLSRRIISSDLIWQTAYSAPHRYADLFDQRILVILDEFQNIAQYVYPDPHFQTAPIETLAGSFHYHVESKIAPMLVTGSYVGLLWKIINQYLEAGRLTPLKFSPYLTPEEGLQAVYKYAEYFKQPITNETAVQLNELCRADPFLISCVILNEAVGKDLATSAGVIEAVNYELTNRDSEMSQTWNEYLYRTLNQVNDRHAKTLLLHLNKFADRYWTPSELKEVLHLDLETNQIQQRLLALWVADLIERGTADIDFRGLQDGTLNIILRQRLEKEINQFVPNLRQEFHDQVQQLMVENRKLRGQLNYLSGKLAEHQLAIAFRSRKRVVLSDFFPDATDTTPLLLVDVRERVLLQRADGKGLEVDVVATATDGRVVLVEVKKTQVKTSRSQVEEFWEKVRTYQQLFPDQKVLAAFLSLGDFTEEALAFCQAQGCATAVRMEQY